MDAEATQRPTTRSVAAAGLRAAAAAAARALGGSVVMGASTRSWPGAGPKLGLRALISKSSRAGATPVNTAGARRPGEHHGIGSAPATGLKARKDPLPFVRGSYPPLEEHISTFGELPLSAAQKWVTDFGVAISSEAGGRTGSEDRLWADMVQMRDADPAFGEHVALCRAFYSECLLQSVVAACFIARKHCKLAWDAPGGSSTCPSQMLKGVLDGLLREPGWSVGVQWPTRGPGRRKQPASSTTTPAALTCIALQFERKRLRTSERISALKGKPAAAPFWKGTGTGTGAKRSRKGSRDPSPVPALPTIGNVLHRLVDQATATSPSEDGQPSTSRRRIDPSQQPPIVAAAPEPRGGVPQ